MLREAWAKEADERQWRDTVTALEYLFAEGQAGTPQWREAIRDAEHLAERLQKGADLSHLRKVFDTLTKIENQSRWSWSSWGNTRSLTELVEDLRKLGRLPTPTSTAQVIFDKLTRLQPKDLQGGKAEILWDLSAKLRTLPKRLPGSWVKETAPDLPVETTYTRVEEEYKDYPFLDYDEMFDSFHADFIEEEFPTDLPGHGVWQGELTSWVSDQAGVEAGRYFASYDCEAEFQIDLETEDEEDGNWHERVQESFRQDVKRAMFSWAASDSSFELSDWKVQGYPHVEEDTYYYTVTFTVKVFRDPVPEDEYKQTTERNLQGFVPLREALEQMKSGRKRYGEYRYDISTEESSNVPLSPPDDFPMKIHSVQELHTVIGVYGPEDRAVLEKWALE